MRLLCIAVLTAATLATAVIGTPNVQVDRPTHQHMYSGTVTSASNASDTMQLNLVCVPVEAGGACTGEVQFSRQRASKAVRGTLRREGRGVVLTVSAIDQSMDCSLTQVVPKRKALGPPQSYYSFNIRCTLPHTYNGSADMTHRIHMREGQFRLP